MLELTEERQTFVFEAIGSTPVLSLLRGFSAPVKIDMELNDATLQLLAAHDDDAFNRWDASQQLASRVLLDLVAKQQAGVRSEAGSNPRLAEVARRLRRSHGHGPTSAQAKIELPAAFVAAFRATLTAKGLEPSLQAYALTLPDYSVLAQEMKPIDPDALVSVLRAARRGLAQQLRAELMATFTELAPPGLSP